MDNSLSKTVFWYICCAETTKVRVPNIKKLPWIQKQAHERCEYKSL